MIYWFEYLNWLSVKRAFEKYYINKGLILIMTKIKRLKLFLCHMRDTTFFFAVATVSPFSTEASILWLKYSRVGLAIGHTGTILVGHRIGGSVDRQKIHEVFTSRVCFFSSLCACTMRACCMRVLVLGPVANYNQVSTLSDRPDGGVVLE